MSHRGRLIVSAWLGFALAALFFYPLAVALDSDSYYMQWQRVDLVETGAALALLTVPLSVGMFHLWGRATRGAAVAFLAITLLPLASFAAGVSRQLPFADLLREAWENRALRLTLPAAVAVLAVLAIARWPHIFIRWFRRALIAVSPVSLVVAGTLVTSASRGAVAVSVDGAPGTVPAGHAVRCAPVLALLFDELSFSYVYDEAGDVRDEFPAIRSFASTATNYMSANAPARETLVAMPSFLAARHLRDVRIEDGDIFERDADGRTRPFNAAEPDSLFATARRLGFATEMGGYYLPYCELLRDLVDVCRSLSFYNYSAVHDRFGPADPVLTTLVLWPRQFPFGLLKNRAFALFQRGLVEHTAAFARRPLGTERPVFRFVHFSVPHLPFVFDAEGYDPPFDPLRTAPDDQYVRQLHYVDRLLDDLFGSMRAAGTYESTTIVVLADHGFRFGGRERDPLQIPFIAKMAGQTERIEVKTPVPGETLLKEVVRRSCGPGGP